MSHCSTNWNLSINGDYTVCDSHIAIMRENSCDKGLVIYIYELHTNTSYSSTANNLAESTINTHTRIKRIKYSCQSMDINYSKYYMSISADGKYLAISWLPNPRMGPQSSMKYCCIYDLTAIPFETAQQISNSQQQHSFPALPMQLIEFYGACVFMADKKLVLLNKDQVRVYQKEHCMEENENRKTFVIDLSVDLCLKNENVALFPGYTYCGFTNTYALVSNDHTIATTTSTTTTTTTAVGDDSANVVLPDSEHNNVLRNKLRQEHPNTLISFGNDMDMNEHENQDIDEFDIDMVDTVDEDVFDYHDIKENIDYEMFCEEHHFIKSNIETIKSASIINVIVNERSDLLLWSLRDRKMVFFDKLDSTVINNEDREQQQPQDLIFAFTPKQNLLAFTKSYRQYKDISRLVNDTPVLNVRDADSGIVISRLYLPVGRSIAGVSQIEFLQDGMYIMIISYSHLTCYFDLYDVASESHLDSFSLETNNQINIDKSVFILNRQIPLEFGCGTFILATHATIAAYRTMNKSETVIDQMVTGDTFFVNSISYEFKKIGFFQDAYENFNRFHDTKNYDKNYVILTLKKESGSSDLFKLSLTYHSKIEKIRIESSCPAYFLDTDWSYLMTYTKLHSSSSYSELTVWRISFVDGTRKGIRLNTNRIIRLEEVVYSFSQNTQYPLSTIVGYPSILYNLTCLSKNNIDRMNPVVIQPNNAEGIPVLIIILNDPRDMTDYSGVYARTSKVNRSVNTEQFTLAIPLNSYTTLECHLHALANECESLKRREKFLRKDLAKIVSIHFFLFTLHNYLII
jgi:hypothetical protein